MSKKRPFSKLFRLSAYPLFCLSNNCIEEVLMKNDYLKRFQLIACNTLILKLDFFSHKKMKPGNDLYIKEKNGLRKPKPVTFTVTIISDDLDV